MVTRDATVSVSQRGLLPHWGQRRNLAQVGEGGAVPAAGPVRAAHPLRRGRAGPVRGRADARGLKTEAATLLSGSAAVKYLRSKEKLCLRWNIAPRRRGCKPGLSPRWRRRAG